MGLGPFGASAPLFLRNGVLLGHSPIRSDHIPIQVARKLFEYSFTFILKSWVNRYANIYIYTVR